MKGYYENSGTGSRFVQLIALALLSVLFFILVSLLITGGDLSAVSSLRVAQLFQSLGFFVVPPIILAVLWSREPLHWLKADKKPQPAALLLVLVIMWTAMPAINLLGEWNQSVVLPESLSGLEESIKSMEADAKLFTEKILAVDTVGGLLFIIGLIALVPAVGEELFFRATIQQLFRSKMGATAAIWLTALIFSFIHFQFYGFIPRMLLGALMGYLMVWSGSLWYPIVAHFVNNATVVVVVFAERKGWINFDLETFGSAGTAAAGYLSIVVATLLLLLFRNLFRRSSS